MQGITVSKPQDLTRSTSDSGAEAEHPRVVVAEDEALIRLDLVELLEEHGYEIVGQASDGEEAVRLANELEPDLIVMDVKMPKMDGIDFLGRIMRLRPMPVLMISLYYLAVALGTALSGSLAGFYSADTEAAYFGTLGAITIGIGVLTLALSRTITRGMRGIR